MTGVVVVGLATRAKRVGVSRWLCAVTHSLGADLRHKRRVSARCVGGHRVVFLNDTVAVSGDPDITLIIDIAAVRSVRHVGRVPIIRAGLDQAGVTPPGYHIAVGIKRDDRGRRDRAPWGGVIPVYCPRHVSLEDAVDCYAYLPPAVEGVDVVILVDAACGDLTLHPGVGHTIGPNRGRQRVGPRGIDRKDGLTVALRARERIPSTDRDRYRGNHRPTKIGILSGFHGVSSSGIALLLGLPVFTIKSCDLVCALTSETQNG